MPLFPAGDGRTGFGHAVTVLDVNAHRLEKQDHIVVQLGARRRQKAHPAAEDTAQLAQHQLIGPAVGEVEHFAQRFAGALLQELAFAADDRPVEQRTAQPRGARHFFVHRAENLLVETRHRAH